jgi:hypothetical protein
VERPVAVPVIAAVHLVPLFVFNASNVAETNRKLSELVRAKGRHLVSCGRIRYATDVKFVYPIYGGPFDLLPEAGALASTTNAIKELIVMVVYRLHGWT